MDELDDLDYLEQNEQMSYEEQLALMYGVDVEEILGDLNDRLQIR